MRRVIIRRRIKLATGKSQVERFKPQDSEMLNRFDPSILGLGDISLPSKEVDAIAAIFSLAGFTRFNNKVNPCLAIPANLNYFLDWLFERLKIGLPANNQGEHKTPWSELPFLARYLGDGVLFLWDTRNMSETMICKIVATLYEICCAYKHQFYPEIRKAVNKLPNSLRCGIARGRVFSLGNSGDYYGHCINIASRLQKLTLFTFCFPRRGFDVQTHMPEYYKLNFIEKSITIRGIIENELVWVPKEEFDNLTEKVKKLLRTPCFHENYLQRLPADDLSSKIIDSCYKSAKS